MNLSFISKLAWRNIRSNRQLYIPYVVSAALTVAMFMMMASLLDNQFIQERAATLPVLFGLGTIVIGVFSLIFIFYINSFLMKRRKKELGLYNILGLEKKHVNAILGMETFLAGGSSILMGILIGTLFGELSFLFLNYLLNFPEPLEYVHNWTAVFMTIGLFAGIFILTTVYNMVQVTFANPIKLLKGSKEGEKEPKGSWLLFILGLASLFAGYFISLTIQDPITALSQFFIAVLLVIIGTYLLFTVGSTVVLKALKKNKSFYYRPGPFISVSGMLYRMKQHAVGLANITILSVMVIIAVSSTVTLFVGSEQTLDNRFPAENNISFATPPEMTGAELKAETEIDFDEVTAYSEENGWNIENSRSFQYINFFGEFRNQTFIPKKTSFKLEGMVMMIPLEEFNKINNSRYQLKANELLYYTQNTDFSDQTLTIGEEDYQVNPLEDVPEMLEARIQLVDFSIVVLPTMQDIEQARIYYNQLAEENSSEEEGYAVNAWSADYYWDLADTTPEENLQYAAEMSDLNEASEAEAYTLYQSKEVSRQEWYSLNGGFLFLGIFLGGLFTLGALLITYFKQISEGFDDRDRIQIMQKVGLDRETTRKATHSQIVWMFTLPILTAGLHTAFAYPIIHKMLILFGTTSHQTLIICTVGVVAAFALIYYIIYRVTSRVYLNIVE